MYKGSISVKQVAVVLGISVKTVRKLIKEGRLPAFRPGKRAFKVRQLDLDDYIENQRRALRREFDNDDRGQSRDRNDE